MARVYMSSTIADLGRERRAVMEWLVTAQHQAVHSYLTVTRCGRVAWRMWIRAPSTGTPWPLAPTSPPGPGRRGIRPGARGQFAALLPIRERILGPDHPHTLAGRGNLARWTGSAGDSAAARDQYAALLPIRERVLGTDHPERGPGRRRTADPILAPSITRDTRLAFPWIALQRWWPAWSKAPRPGSCKP